MKSILCLLLASLLGATFCPAQNPAPYESLNFSIDIGDSWKRIFENRKGKFSVTLRVYQEARNQLPNCSTEIHCWKLQSRYDNMGKADVEALVQVTDAAAAGKAMKLEVPYYKTAFDANDNVAELAGKELKTVYESKLKTYSWKDEKNREKWLVTIQRESAELEVSDKEVAELQMLLKEANTAILWYETLLTSPHAPKPAITAKPPTGSLKSFSSVVGKTANGKIDYEVYIQEWEQYDRLPEGLIHMLNVTLNDNARVSQAAGDRYPIIHDGHHSFMGEWVRDMMIHVTHAAAAAQKQEAYSFVGNHQGARYEVSADPTDKTARLRIHPKFDASDLSFVDTVFDLNTAREIASLILRGDEAAKWYKDNKALFVTPVAP